MRIKAGTHQPFQPKIKPTADRGSSVSPKIWCIDPGKAGLGSQDFNGTFVAYCKTRAGDLPDVNIEDTEAYCAQSNCLWPECNFSDQCYVYTPDCDEDCYLGNKTIQETFYFKYGKLSTGLVPV